MGLTEELDNIQKTGEIAWQMVANGDFRNARRALKKIRNSFCVSESTRIITLIEAKILERTGKLEEAKERVLRSIYYVWGIPDGFDIISLSNPRIDAGSRHYYIEILGGLATLGAFTQFSHEHVASFDVIANSLEEARGYINEVANFADPQSARVITCDEQEIDDDTIRHRGVLLTHPFRILRTN
jgi:hypothetical protein